MFVVGIMVVMTNKVLDRVSRGKDESARLDTSGSNQTVSKFSDDLGWTSEQDHFETTAAIEVDVSRRYHGGEMEMLQLG